MADVPKIKHLDMGPFANQLDLLFRQVEIFRIPICFFHRCVQNTPTWTSAGNLRERTPYEAGVPEWIMEWRVHKSNRQRLQRELAPYFLVDNAHIAVSARKIPLSDSFEIDMRADLLCMIAHTVPDAYAEIGWEDLDCQLWDLMRNICLPLITSNKHALSKLMMKRSDTAKDNVIRFLMRFLFWRPTKSLTYLTSNIEYMLASIPHCHRPSQFKLHATRLDVFSNWPLEHMSLFPTDDFSRQELTAISLSIYELGRQPTSRIPDGFFEWTNVYVFSESRLPTHMELIATSILSRDLSTPVMSAAIDSSRPGMDQILGICGLSLSRDGFSSIALECLDLALSKWDNPSLVMLRKSPTAADNKARGFTLLLAEVFILLSRSHHSTDQTSLQIPLHYATKLWLDLDDFGDLTDGSTTNLRLALSDYYLDQNDFEEATSQLKIAIGGLEYSMDSDQFVSAVLRLSKIRRSEGSYAHFLYPQHPLRRAALKLESMSQEARFAVAQELSCGFLNVDLLSLRQNLLDVMVVIQAIETAVQLNLEQPSYQALKEKCRLVKERVGHTGGTDYPDSSRLFKSKDQSGKDKITQAEPSMNRPDFPKSDKPLNTRQKKQIPLLVYDPVKHRLKIPLLANRRLSAR